MALPNRLWLPDGGQDLPVFPVERVSAEVVPPPGPRWRKRAVLAGVEGQAERTVLVEWFSVADLALAQLEPLRSVCHSNLLRLHQFGQSDGKTAYAISEAPLGLDLLHIVRNLAGKLPAWWAVSVVYEAARGVQALHHHLAQRGRVRGHGALDASCVFVSSAGRVQVLAFAPLPKLAAMEPLGEDPIAPEVRRGAKLAMAASDVYSLGTLLQSLPIDRPLPDALLRLLRRCQSLFAEKRPTLALLIKQLGDARWQLGAPLALAERIGSELGRLLPATRSQSLGDSEWGSAGPVSFGPLPRTLYPLSATAVSLSATWDAAPQVEVGPRPPLPRVSASLVLVCVLALLGGVGGWLLSKRPLPASVPSQGSLVVPSVPPGPAGPQVTIHALRGPAPDVASSLRLRVGERGRLGGLRVSVLRSEASESGLLLSLLLVNGTTQPLRLDPMSLRVSASPDAQAFAPEPSPVLSLSPGQMQALALRFVGPLPIGGLSLWLQR